MAEDGRRWALRCLPTQTFLVFSDSVECPCCSSSLVTSGRRVPVSSQCSGVPEPAGMVLRAGWVRHEAHSRALKDSTGGREQAQSSTGLLQGFTTRKEGNCQEVPFLERGRCLFKGESQRIPSESQFLGNAGLSNLMVKRSLCHVGKVQCPAKCSFLKLPQQDYTPHLDIHIPVCRLFLGRGAARAPCSVSPNLI